MLVKGHGLSGPDKLSVEPGGEETCIITYSPTLVGETTGRFVGRVSLYLSRPHATHTGWCSLAVRMENFGIT